MRKIHSRLLEPFTGTRYSDVQVGNLISSVTRVKNICTNAKHGEQHVFHGQSLTTEYPRMSLSLPSKRDYEMLINAVGWHYVRPEQMALYHTLHTQAAEHLVANLTLVQPNNDLSAFKGKLKGKSH